LKEKSKVSYFCLLFKLKIKKKFNNYSLCRCRSNPGLEISSIEGRKELVFLIIFKKNKLNKILIFFFSFRLLQVEGGRNAEPMLSLNCRSVTVGGA